MKSVHYKIIGDSQPEWVWHQRSQSLGSGDSSNLIFALPELRRVPRPLAEKRYARFLLDTVHRSSADLSVLSRQWLKLDHELSPGVRHQPVPFAILRHREGTMELAANYEIGVVRLVDGSCGAIAPETISFSGDLFPPRISLWRLPRHEAMTVVIVPSAGRPPAPRDFTGILVGVSTRKEAVERIAAAIGNTATPMLIIAFGGQASIEDASGRNGAVVDNKYPPILAPEVAATILASIREIQVNFAGSQADWKSRIDEQIARVIDPGIYQRLLDRLEVLENQRVDQQIIFPLCRQFMQIYDMVDGSINSAAPSLEVLKNSISNALSLHDVAPFRHVGAFDPVLQELLDGTIPPANGHRLISQRCGFRRGQQILRREKVSIARNLPAAMERSLVS